MRPHPWDLRAALALPLVALALAGCLGTTPEAGDATANDPFAGTYPPRDGSLWPRDLVGPFDSLGMTHVALPSFDGTLLDGWLERPALPDGVTGPVLINSSPYLAAESDTAGNEGLVRAGFAVAKFSVRGTGNSGGCMDFFGANEQRDQAALVEWAAGQPWSNGRVGFFGGSYRGTTTLQAAVQSPPGLHAAVAVAPVPDLFTLMATPQGALWNQLPAQLSAAFTGFAAAPRLLGDDTAAHLESALALLGGGDLGLLCPEIVQAFGQLSLEPWTTMRDHSFFQERDLRPRLSDIQVPLLWTDGYYDDQYFQGPHAWSLVTGAPFQYITGPWPHATPSSRNDTAFTDLMTQWFDFWLKGMGEPPADLGKAVWQDTLEPGVYPSRGDGAWHVSTAWPPPEAQATWFNLTHTDLSTTEPGAQRSFRAVPVPEGTAAPVLGEGGWQWPKTFLCDDLAVAGGAFRITYSTEPSDQAWLVAGIPTLDLTITSDAPGGIVNVFLILVDGDHACTDDEGPALISFGAADLLFVDDIYNATAFPVGTPTHIQIELTDIAQVIQPGQRLVLVVGAGNPADHLTRYAPTVTIHEGTPEGPTGLTLPIMPPA